MTAALLAGWLAAGSAPARSAVQPLRSIMAAAEAFVRARMPAGQSGIVVTANPLDPRLRLARCEAPLDASLLAGARLASEMSVAVGCRRGPEWTIYVPVTVRARIRVWALREPQAQGARLNTSEVIQESRWVAGVPVGYVTDPAQLARSTLRHPMPAGAVLKTTDLLPDWMVRQGEQVAVVASIGGIEVRAPGVALQDGRYGALIRVQNTSSSKVVQGIVQGDGVVEVSP